MGLDMKRFIEISEMEIGISGQTADNWARAGKVEKIHDSSRKVRYRMLERAS